jgi:glycosyltransferase involved in cell wall biosynthesis
MTRKVQLHFGRFVHPVYREQLHSVPAGWEYVYTHPALSDQTVGTKRIVESASKLAPAKALAERVALRVLSEGGYVHQVRAQPLPGTELFHSAERLLFRPAVPYVLDLEHVELFVLYQRAAFERPWARELLERALLDPRLRFLLPWSEAARRSVLTAVSPETAAKLEPKLQVVYPAIRPHAERPRHRPDGPLRVLFVGTHFFEKGGVEALRSIQTVRRTHDVTLDILTYAPPEYAARLSTEPGVTVHAPGGANLVQRLYANADVLLFPSHMDTFGYVVMEAMSHALPVLAPGHLALTESVLDGESGLLFRPENMLYEPDTRCAFRHVLPPPKTYLEALEHPSDTYVQSIAAAMARLSEDRDLYGRLSRGALDSVQTGQFSVARRQERLGTLYAEAAR